MDRFEDKVEGEVERGQPVEVHTCRQGRERKILTYYGWFREPPRAFVGDMEVCCKMKTGSEDEFHLADLQIAPLDPEDIEKIVPLRVVE